MAIPTCDQLLHQRTHAESTTRRSFVSRAASGIAAFGLFGGVPRVAEAQLVWKAARRGSCVPSPWRDTFLNPPAVHHIFDDSAAPLCQSGSSKRRYVTTVYDKSLRLL